MLFSLPHAILLGRLPDAERRRAENDVIDELAACEREGSRLTITARQAKLRRDEVGFICSRPPLEALELANAPWPGERTVIGVLRDDDESLAGTLYFRAELERAPFPHVLSHRLVTDRVSFAFHDRTKRLVRGRRLPGTLAADFVRTVDGVWLQYQLCFDEWLVSDAVARDTLSRLTLEQCYVGLKAVRSHAMRIPLAGPTAA